MRKTLWMITSHERSLSCYDLIRSHYYGIPHTYKSPWSFLGLPSFQLRKLVFSDLKVIWLKLACFLLCIVGFLYILFTLFLPFSHFSIFFLFSHFSFSHFSFFFLFFLLVFFFSLFLKFILLSHFFFSWCVSICFCSFLVCRYVLIPL